MTISQDIIKLIQNSGNNFHSRVARWFADNGWHVVISPYYMDQVQNKAREIDLVAEKIWPTTDEYGNPDSNIAIRLFIECKFVTSDTVFWFVDKDRELAKNLVCTSGLFRPNNSYTDKHHYLAQGSRVAKLFATQKTKSAENEPFYNALNQALNAMTSMRGQPITIPSIRESRRNPKKILEYPVVVCSSFDRMFAVDFYSDPEPELIRDNFQLEVFYAYLDRQERQRSECFLLDFVDFEKLTEFEEAINNEGRAAAYLASK